MFGRMNIEKATKFYLTNPRITNLKTQLKPESNVLASLWTGYEQNVYTEFKRKYRVDLSIEQRWYITLEVFRSCPYSIDSSLNEFLKRGISDVSVWSVRARARFAFELGFPDELSEDEILKGFPFFPLFLYSLNNYETVYPNNALAKRFVLHLQQVDKLKGKKEIDDWYSTCGKFLKSE